MKDLILHKNPKVREKLSFYPEEVRQRLDALRNLILETASEIESIPELEETLKWGEPSYLAKKGSTVRMDWKPRTPHQYALYFKCTSKLVPTFREVYGDLFRYENNRAILFSINDELPKKEVKECIKVALTYHSVKDKDRLGMDLDQSI
ncbi:MAG: DUF1801 domain-containing protein [Bacteroidota bacterium]